MRFYIAHKYFFDTNQSMFIQYSHFMATSLYIFFFLLKKPFQNQVTLAFFYIFFFVIFGQIKKVCFWSFGITFSGRDNLRGGGFDLLAAAIVRRGIRACRVRSACSSPRTRTGCSWRTRGWQDSPEAKRSGILSWQCAKLKCSGLKASVLV